MDEQLKAYFQTVEERQQDFREKARSLLESLVGAKAETKIAFAERALSSLSNLISVISKSRRPGWFDPTVQRLTEFIGAKGNGNTPETLMSQLIGSYDSIFNQNLAQRTPTDDGVDFESIYREAHKSSKLPELFDRLASILQQVIDSEQIDSVRAMSTLETLISLLRKNRAGTYFSAYSTFQVVGAGLRHIPFQMALDVPLVAGFVRGVNAAMHEIGMEWDHVRQDVRDKIRTTFSFNLTALGTSAPTEIPEPRLEGPERPS